MGCHRHHMCWNRARAGSVASGAEAANPWPLITSHSSTRIETAAIAPRFLQPHRSIVSLSNFHTEPRSRTKIDFICVSVTAGLRSEYLCPIIFYFNFISRYIDEPLRFYIAIKMSLERCIVNRQRNHKNSCIGGSWSVANHGAWDIDHRNWSIKSKCFAGNKARCNVITFFGQSIFQELWVRNGDQESWQKIDFRGNWNYKPNLP